MAKPRSTKDIRKLATNLREVFELDKTPKFPVVEFLEIVLPIMDSKFEYHIISKDEMGTLHGLTCPEEHCIKIREDVYDRACLGYGRDRFTIAREIGHYLMHGIENITLARLGNNKKVQAYEDPEWQANTFAAELLMPLNLINTNNATEISEKFGVSYSAAAIRVKKINMH